MRFTRAYAAAPVCSPSRATLFTGRYPQVHGVTQNNLPFKPGEVTLPQLLRAQGYTTAMVGKLHLQGYEDWFDEALIDTAGNSAEYRAFLRAEGQQIQGTAEHRRRARLARRHGPHAAADRHVVPARKTCTPRPGRPTAPSSSSARRRGRTGLGSSIVSMLKPHSEFVIPRPVRHDVPGA